MDSFILEAKKRKSRIPARLDLAQSITGLILGLFMWAHMCLVGSIIFGKGAFYFVAQTMELAFLSPTGHGYPFAVFCAVAGVFILFIVHAMLGIRKFPINWKQHRIIRDQINMLNHEDTNLWYIQVVTGFIMFFAGSFHLYMMLSNPGSIGPYLSADRVFSHSVWPLYLVLLICVELHGTIGLYRLCLKWGWFTGKDAKQSRAKLKKLKKILTYFFLTLGILALLAFLLIGYGHRNNVGERYSKAHVVEEKAAPMVEQEPVVKEEPKALETPEETDQEVPPLEHETEHKDADLVREIEQPAQDGHNKAVAHEDQNTEHKEQ